MRQAKESGYNGERRTIDTLGLQAMLGCGKRSAVRIGTAANAKITLGKRVLWNVRKIEMYLDTISE